MHDLIIAGGRVLDGTGAPEARVDVAVRDGRIAAVADRIEDSARARLDAHGCVVAPGFIDMHAHDDFNLPVNPFAHGKIAQGVTTVVNGNCGYSPAPLDPLRAALHAEIAVTLDSGLDYAWRDMRGFLDAHPRCGVNVCQLVGHNAVRCAVMGVEPRAPDDRELDTMRAHVDEAMTAGAFGFSSGLVGPPSGHASTDEVAALAEVAAGHGGGYHTHMRNEGARVEEAIEEAIEIGRRSGARVQISHLKISDPGHHGIATRLLERVARAREAGHAVHCDQYPYVASSGGLRARLPGWAQGGPAADVIARLRDPDTRARVRHELEEGMTRAGVSMRIYRWEDVRVGMSPSRPDLVGRTLAEVARDAGAPPAEAMIDLLIADGLATRGIYFHMSESDVRRILADPHVAVGSDGLYTGRPDRPDESNPHPRHYGTFARVLGHYAREERVLGLPEAVRKMTGLPAALLGLDDRGRVAAGCAADLVVFDPDSIADRATFDEPHREAAGVDTVLVEGVAVVAGGRATGATPGRVLRHRAASAGRSR